jgi:hypothetical protein
LVIAGIEKQVAQRARDAKQAYEANRFLHSSAVAKKRIKAREQSRKGAKSEQAASPESTA